MANKILIGEVVSDKMNKTIVVKTAVVKRHRKYRKQYKVFKKYKAHDETNEYKTGDIVEIRESKPISREKKWVVIRKIK